MRRIIILFLCLITLVTTAIAHVGSPDVVMEGTAGPYKILVSIRPPDVIPGKASVKVYLQNGTASSIGIRSVYFVAGDEGAPEPDGMNKVAGQEQYIGETWLMTSGSSSVQIQITGNLGKGELVVPVVAASTARKSMPASTGWTLAALGVFLFVLMVTIIGASVSDALTKTGEVLSARAKRFRVLGMVTGALLTSLIVYGGNAWWQSWANRYRKFMFKPTEATTRIDPAHSNELLFTLDTASQRKASFSYVVPDHGKMMHMFVMRYPAMDAFAHLHPERIDSVTYRTSLPGLPKGRYIAFADIVYTSGYTETIRDTFDIASDLPTADKLDKDDAFAFAIPADLVDNPVKADSKNTIICGKPGSGVKLKDGSSMVWEGMTNEPLDANQLYQLNFSVIGSDNKPAALQPYLGMAGHAAIIRDDANVYIHLHPVGTFSVAAETNLVKRIADPQGVYSYPDRKKFYDSINHYVNYLSSLSEGDRDKILMKDMVMPQAKAGSGEMDHSNTVSFPYSFPSPGKYRIWVQVKRNGEVLTGAFDREVK